MRSRMTVVMLMLLAFLPLSAIGTADPVTKWAAVLLTEPTLIGDSYAMGPVLFEHDDARMARGEPCTVVYQFESGKGPTKALASFHCKPNYGKTAPDRFAMTTGRDGRGNCVLRSYQFAGDTEAHGVPTAWDR
jgi:hypothetical protein